MMKNCLSILVLAAGCATARVPAARFAIAPAVTVVNDRAPTAAPPAPRQYLRTLVHLRSILVRPIDRALALPRERRALGVNALDEVPSSTWFTNRIGVRELSPDEIRRGPATIGSPEAHRPWTVLSTKVGGMNVGFVIRDARGETFILKFDKRGFPETETAAGAIAGRLLWAAGYNVPEDHVVYFRAADLVLAADAKIKDQFGGARPLGARDLERLLGEVDVESDGRIRGLASRMLEGTWLGGHPAEGTRPDDPNDRIPHELRRDLRGSYAIFAWLDHIDIKEDNYLDMWVADPADPDVHYVKHYLVDFGSALGSTARTSGDLRSGHEYFLDLSAMVTSAASLGLRERAWEAREAPELRGLGVFGVTGFSPGAWKPNNQSYLPFLTADRFDNFWGAKLVMRFTPAQIAAAVDTGRYSDPRTASYVTRTLVARQRAVGRYWFSRVAPLDRPEVVQAADGYHVCFVDLALAHRLVGDALATRYAVASFDRQGAPLGGREVLAPAGARTCTGAVALAPAADAYTIVELRTTRPGLDASTFVHLARSGGAVTVVGVWRQ